MLTIGEFSNICQVSTKTLRYYAEIGLLQPYEINPENGYRYYAIEQLETMLLIERLKTYHFSLEEIKELLSHRERLDEGIYQVLIRKKQEIKAQAQEAMRILSQLEQDMTNLEKGKSLLSYLEDIDIQLVEVEPMCLLSTRCMVKEDEFQKAYQTNFSYLLKRIATERLTLVHPPMVLFHSSEFSPLGMDSEFAFPIQEAVTGTRDFTSGLCIKTVNHGPYSNLSSIYTKQWEWMEENGYENAGPLFEVYVNDPEDIQDASELITEIYLPVNKKKKLQKKNKGKDACIK